MMGVWRQAGFGDFARGRMGNAGQNLYVSRGGVLQRIHQYSVQKSGYVDLLFCSSQNHWERPPAYVYPNPLKDTCRVSLPSDGAMSGAVAGLDGDGYDDLVLGMWANGIRQDLNAIIYFGSPDGFSEECVQHLPAPRCRSVAVGDFNGDGRPDIAFLLDKAIRVFYQTELGFEPRRFVEYAIQADHICAFDVDRDGFCDLLVRQRDGTITIHWGHPEGLSLERSLRVPVCPG